MMEVLFLELYTYWYNDGRAEIRNLPLRPKNKEGRGQSVKYSIVWWTVSAGDASLSKYLVCMDLVNNSCYFHNDKMNIIIYTVLNSYGYCHGFLSKSNVSFMWIITCFVYKCLPLVLFSAILFNFQKWK